MGRPVVLIAVVTLACLGFSAEVMVSLGAVALLGKVLFALAVGLVEDLMFRGVLLSGLRGSRVPELAVMLITSAAFGLMHLVGVIGGEPLDSTLLQAFTASLMGATLYLALRVSGTLLVPILLHALWDLALDLDVSALPLAGTLHVVGFLLFNLGAFVAIALVIVGAVRARRSRVAAGGPVVAN
ncbi:CPBP family intramembrane glutamic endopeptidase [Microbacterium sp. SA39]|uniref:CPBP family intramembrane glutamic endopeptidase n=1 Tax=Microbacterium sp. SA39 TaxID=1263625 RepID=UPI0012698EDD|nr:CPBP family intramembrane glutamic endopeptidase [Microbacterium sp. SA39]